MVVAGIAWARLTPAAKARAAALLELNPDYAMWVKGVPAAQRDRIAFMQAATWPDDLRGRTCKDHVTDPPDCIVDDKYDPPDAGSDLNIGYRDRRLRRYWHFMDLPFSNDGTPTKPPFAYNAETQITLFATSLADVSLGDEPKSFDLVWLLHLVGDVHQPLHATSRFNAAFPDGDNGGNGVVVCRPKPAKCETYGKFVYKLHALWDESIGTDSNVLSARNKADALLKAADNPATFLAAQTATAGVDSAPIEWVRRSASLAQSYAYVPPIGPGRTPYYLTPTYRAKVGSIAEQQIVIAGLRLATLLNARLM